MAKMLEHFKQDCQQHASEAHVTYKSLYITDLHVYHRPPISMGHSSLALHIITLPFYLSYNALHNAQSTCQTSESVNKVIGEFSVSISIPIFRFQFPFHFHFLRFHMPKNCRAWRAPFPAIQSASKVTTREWLLW